MNLNFEVEMSPSVEITMHWINYSHCL